MAVYTAEYTFPNDLSHQVYVKARQVKRNGVARTFASCTNASADVWIDITDPIVSISGVFSDASGTTTAINNDNFTTTSTIYLGYTITDAASGLVSSTYSINGGAEVALSGSPMAIELTDNIYTPTTIAIKGTDNAGNSTTSTVSFYVDTAIPTATAAPIVGIDGRSIHLISISTPTSNFSHNIFSFYNFTTDELITEISSTNNIAIYTTATDLSYKVYGKVRQVKKSGKEGTNSPSSTAVWVDITPPILTVTTTDIGTQYCTTATASVTVSATDAHSGVASVKAIVDGVTSSTLTNESDNSISLGSDSLTKTLKIVATDNKGNSSSWERTFIQDTTPPTGLVSADITSIFGRTITWTVDLSSATDATSGLAGYEIRSADSGWGDSSYVYKGQESIFIQKPSTNASSTLFFALYDKAGNYATAVSSTAISYPPALVSSASISYIPEINAVQAAWDTVVTNNQGSSTDAIAGYRYFCSYKLTDGTYTSSSATVYTTLTNTAFVPIPLANILTTGDNSLKMYIKAFDVWGASSTSWAVSDIMTTRKVVGTDLSGNCFQFRAIAVQGDGTKTVNFSTTGETIDEDLNLIIDGLFDNT